MEHCATRLRLIVKDKSLINEKAIENIDGVRGQFFAAAQYQIILGTGFVNKVFAAMNGEGVETGNVKEDAYSDMTLPQKISRTLGDIFVPIIPVLVATGLFMGLRGLLTNLGVEFSPTFNTLSEVLTDTAFIFLPALVAWSTMKKFGGTPVVGIVLGAYACSPSASKCLAGSRRSRSNIYFFIRNKYPYSRVSRISTSSFSIRYYSS